MTPRWFGGGSPQPEPTKSEEQTSLQRETTSAETGETERQSVPIESAQERTEDKKDAIREQENKEKMMSQQQREEQEEMADLTLVIEEP